MANIQYVKIGSNSYTVTIPYVTCATAAGTAAKTVTYAGTELIAGTSLNMKLTNGNTASSPTLSVNGGTAKNIVGTGSCAPASFSTAGSVMHLVYDGTQWMILG